MDFFDCVHGRRTVHLYEPVPLSQDVLDRVLAAGHQAPNHKHTWPWRFTPVGSKCREQLLAVALRIKSKDHGLTEHQQQLVREKIMNPGALIVVSQVSCDDPFRGKEDYAAVACAIQNMLLAITAEGFGGKWGTGALTRAAETYDILDIDSTQETIVGFVWLGTPKQVPNISRPLLSDVVRERE